MTLSFFLAVKYMSKDIVGSYDYVKDLCHQQVINLNRYLAV